MANVKWHARKARLYTAPATSITLDNSISLATQFTGASGSMTFDAYIKDVAVTPPELSFEPVACLGEDSNGFQNQFMELKTESAAKITGTMVMQGDEVLEDKFLTALSTASYSSYGYNQSKLLTTQAVLITLSDGTDTVNICMKTPYMKFGERKITGTDGHWEQSFEMTSLPADYREQFLN